MHLLIRGSHHTAFNHSCGLYPAATLGGYPLIKPQAQGYMAMEGLGCDLSKFMSLLT